MANPNTKDIIQGMKQNQGFETMMDLNRLSLAAIAKESPQSKYWMANDVVVHTQREGETSLCYMLPALITMELPLVTVPF